jgi:hypothetical protein
MKKIYLVFLIVLVSNQLLFSQKSHNWLSLENRNTNYPESFFIQGFSSKNIKKQEDIDEILKKLTEYAKLNLIESVKVSIKGISELYTREVDNTVKQHYKEIIASSASLDIVGLKVETYYNYKKRIAYAFAYANKSDVAYYYKNIIDENIGRIEGNIDISENALKKGDNQYALKKYQESFPILRETEEAQSIYMVLKSDNLNDENLQMNKTLHLKKQIDVGLRNIEKRSDLTLDNVCSLLAFTIKDQAKQINDRIHLVNFTYQDTRMGSEFSFKLNHILQNILIQDVGYDVATEISHLEEKTSLMLFGTYWEESNGIKIITTLKNIQTGNILASAQVTLPTSYLDQNEVSVKPENFENAYSRIKLFNKNEIFGGDLNLEFWTNKGDNNLVFTEGEKMKIFVRSNKECYLRIIYHLADGSAVLLLDNYYVSSDKVNMIYELPYKFECSSPFGVEILQVNGQTQKFSALQIINQGGYDIIQNDLNTMLINTRGMKLTEDLMMAEQRIVITTLGN